MNSLAMYCTPDASSRQVRKLLRKQRWYSRKLAAALRSGNTPEIIFNRASLGVIEDHLVDCYRKEGLMC